MVKKKTSRKKEDSLFGDVAGLGRATIGFGISAGIGAGAEKQLPGSGVTKGFSAGASFFPVINTAVLGGRTIKIVKKLNKKKNRYSEVI